MGACGWGLGARGDRGSGERTNSGTGESDCRKLPHENVLHFNVEPEDEKLCRYPERQIADHVI
jgi:hypothetical protein